jgi:hypothetical protein
MIAEFIKGIIYMEKPSFQEAQKNLLHPPKENDRDPEDEIQQITDALEKLEDTKVDADKNVKE